MINKQIIIQFKGPRKSGKTTLITHLTKIILKENSILVISIKKIHNPDFTIDQIEKNSWQMAQAGSNLVVTNSEYETAFIIKSKIPENHIIKIANFICKNVFERKIKYWILIEGFISEKFPTILTIEKIEDIEIIFNEFIQNKNFNKIIKNILFIGGKFSSEIQNDQQYK